jgi:DNA-binding transcriptional LysR family regulator
MKSEYFQTLIEAVALGSFSKAAEKLFVTQSAISRRIQFLEEHYGFPLVDRSGPLLVATEAGRIVMEKASKVIALEKELIKDLHEYERKPTVTFCCTPAFGVAFLPAIMQNFILSHLSVAEMNYSFEMPGKIIEGLREGLYQAGVIEHYEQFDFFGFETFSLPEDALVFVSSPRFEIDNIEIDIEQLLKYDLYIRKEGCSSSNLLLYNLKNLGRCFADFARTIVCDDLHLIIKTVSEGRGVTFVARSVVDKYLRDGTLCEHRIKGFDHKHLRTLIVNSSYSENPLLKDFVAEIFAAFAMTGFTEK